MSSQSGAKMPLEKELETYHVNLESLKADEGKFVLIQGTRVVGTYTSYEDAVKVAYTEFGTSTPFLVKQIQTIDRVHFISRFVDPCPTLSSN